MKLSRSVHSALSRFQRLSLATVLVCASAHAASPNPLTISDLILPQSQAWLTPAKLPPLPAAELAAQQSAMKDAYAATNSNAAKPNGTDAPSCAVIDQILDGSHAHNFYKLDVNHDKTPDIVYIGPSGCGADPTILVWLSFGSKLQMQSTSNWPNQILRMSKDGQFVVSFAPGGDSPVDTYYLGSPFEPDVEGALRFVRDTELPHGKLNKPLHISTKVRTTLRLQPKVIEPAAGVGATFSNLVRAYLPGATGTAVAEAKVGGKRWLFVILEPESDGRALEDPYKGVRIGWMPANDLEIGPISAPVPIT